MRNKTKWWFNLYKSVVIFIICLWMESYPSIDDEWYRVLPIGGIFISLGLFITSIIELKRKC